MMFSYYTTCLSIFIMTFDDASKDSRNGLFARHADSCKAAWRLLAYLRIGPAKRDALLGPEAAWHEARSLIK